VTYYFVVSAINNVGQGNNSAQASGTTPAGPTYTINFSNGFSGAGSALQTNGAAQVVGNTLALTNGGTNEVSSVFDTTAQNVASFTTQFDFQLTGTWPLGDGFTFVIQGAGTSAIGGGGGGLGYSGIANSVAIKFDLFDNSGEGNNSTGLYINGQTPTNLNSVDLDGTGFNMRSYDPSQATISYNGTTLTVVLKDLVTGATATQQYVVNIPAIVGGGTAYVGFTAASGALTAVQNIQSWTFANGSN
jgi:hypothetical protein